MQSNKLLGERNRLLLNQYSSHEMTFDFYCVVSTGEVKGEFCCGILR